MSQLFVPGIMKKKWHSDPPRKDSLSILTHTWAVFFVGFIQAVINQIAFLVQTSALFVPAFELVIATVRMHWICFFNGNKQQVQNAYSDSYVFIRIYRKNAHPIHRRSPPWSRTQSLWIPSCLRRKRRNCLMPASRCLQINSN